MTDEIKYEHKTVQTVRGTDGLVISKMEKDGWEFVDQTTGTVRTTLNFRRPKKPVRWILIGAAAAGALLLATIIGVGAALESDDEKPEADEPANSASETPTPTSSASVTPTPTQSAAIEVLTPQNNMDLAALLKGGDCDDSVALFATTYAGRTIAFNGSVAAMGPHGDTDTRYDILVSAGDKGENSTVGPSFQFADVNIFDLNLTGNASGTFGVNDKARFTADVGEFSEDNCLFYLEPIKTEVR